MHPTPIPQASIMISSAFIIIAVSIIGSINYAYADDNECSVWIQKCSNSAEKNCTGWSNGCSIPGNMYYFYKDLFTRACYHHDICYLCGAQHNYYLGYMYSKATCDSIFRYQLELLCGTKHYSWSPQYLFCKGTALLYYKSVVHFGGKYYEENPKKECQKGWILKCITYFDDYFES